MIVYVLFVHKKSVSKRKVCRYYLKIKKSKKTLKKKQKNNNNKNIFRWVFYCQQCPQAVNRRRLDHFTAASATASGTSGPPAPRSSGGQSKLTDFFRSQPTPRSVAASANTAPRAAAAMVNGMSEDEALAAAMAASLQDVNQQQQAVRGGGSSSGQSSRQVLTQVWKLIEICISKPLNILKFFEQFL
jgi:hypothetical protein